MKKFILLIAVALLIPLSISAASAGTISVASYIQTLYNSDSKMEANDANDVIQTRDGYIWIASYRGLIRYDGKTFTLYNKNSSTEFAASSARCLYEDEKGRLWIGTNLDGLFCLEGGRFRSIPNLSDSAFNLVHSIVSDSKGNIFVGSSGGVGRLTEEGIERISLGRFDTAFVLDLECDSEDNILGVSRSGEVFLFKDGRIKQVFSEDDFPGSGAVSLLVRSDGTVVAGMNDGGIARLAIEEGSYNFR